MEKNIINVIDELTVEEKEELEVLHKELSNIKDKGDNNVIQVEDKSLKKRLAKFCLQLIDETPINQNDKRAIQETSYLISGFMQYQFGDKLDEVFGIAGELELPEHHVSGNVIKMFNKIKRILKKYLQ